VALQVMRLGWMDRRSDGRADGEYQCSRLWIELDPGGGGIGTGE
jgi:hypothetical protein